MGHGPLRFRPLGQFLVPVSQGTRCDGRVGGIQSLIDGPDGRRVTSGPLSQFLTAAGDDLEGVALAKFRCEDWLERLTAEGVPCAPVLTRTQMLTDPQVVANGIVVETEHEQAGRLRQARPAARFSETPASIRRGGPGLGEHTAEVLAELGFSKAESESLTGGLAARKNAA